MARFIKGVPVVIVLLAGVGIAVGLSGTTKDAGKPADEGFCVADEFGAMQSLDSSVAAKPCKPCKDRPWCGCTYNGAPRISCNPCCYNTYPYPTCYD
jgi:hypothetical protein